MLIDKLLDNEILISDTITPLYHSDSQRQIKRYQQSLKAFKSYFNDQQINVFSTPGRVELCGNHTDHQFGKVLAGAINLDAIAVVAKSDNINIFSEGYAKISLALTDLSYQDNEKYTSQALIKGILKRFETLNYHIGGFNAYITSDVLNGSGISSSASFEVLIAKIINYLYNDDQIDSLLIAQIAQYSEINYFGKPSGLMDQIACNHGGIVGIDFADHNKPKVNSIELDLHKYDLDLILVKTRSSHDDLSEEYGLMVSEMKLVAKYFQKDVLSQVDPLDFYQNIAKLSVLDNDRAILRAHHFFQETKRVDDAFLALEKNDMPLFLNILKTSGYSSYMYLQNIFANNDHQHQQLALALAMSEKKLAGLGAAFRVHGGGLGGTILVLCPSYFTQNYIKFMNQIFDWDCCLKLEIRNQGSICVF